MAQAAANGSPRGKLELNGTRGVGGPVAVPWREGTLTRAAELEALSIWVVANHCPPEDPKALVEGIQAHLTAARQAAEGKQWPWRQRLRLFRTASMIQRAMSNLDAAEAELLNFAPPQYVLGQMPGLLNHVQRHLLPTDPRRLEFERIAQRLRVKDPDHPLVNQAKAPRPAGWIGAMRPDRMDPRRLIGDRNQAPMDHPRKLTQAERTIDQERGKIVTIVRGASSAALREQLRLRSFRKILIATLVGLIALTIGIAVFGWLYPTRVPLCFQPSLESGQSVVVCPTAYSARLGPDQLPGRELNGAVSEAVRPWDNLTVELVGLTAAAVVATTRIRGIRGSSEAPGLPVLLRGQFVPGLSALDTPAQILSWALVFGFAQQLFTRLVDQQGQIVLNSVRAADRPAEPVPRRA
jgi:hypothetical protein